MKPIRMIFLTVASFLIGANLVYAQLAFSGDAFSGQLGKLKPQVEYQTAAISSESVHSQHTDLSFVQQGMQVQVPLWQNERFESAWTTGLEVMDLASRAVLTDAGVPLPDHLWSLDVAGRVRTRLENEWIAGLNVSIGSSSDKLFDSASETTFGSTATLQVPADNRNHHLFFLNFATHREFLPNIPIPGYAYQWNSHPKTRAMFGLPFNWVQYAITEKLTAQASYFIPRTVHAKISYELADGLKLFTGFNWQNQRWYRADRDDDDDRLCYYEKNAALGLQWNPTNQLTMTVQSGYGFDRFFFEGEDYDDRDDNRINISDGPFLSASVRLHF